MPEKWPIYCSADSGCKCRRGRATAIVGSMRRRSGAILMHRTLFDQIRGNSVALMSRVVAVGSLGYNTWRNERTEQNRNIRSAGFRAIDETW
ncbi:MAG: hypothetical protein C0629_01200 [Chromatiales bacterium]|nr:MAG: hypothetical protein C0629_01200 [Chromatiales bacterium]